MADNTNDDGGECAVPDGTDSRVTDWFGQSVASDTELAEQLSRDHDPDTADHEVLMSSNVGGGTASIPSSVNAPTVRTIPATPPTSTEPR